MKVKSESEVAQLYPTVSDPMDCSLPGSSNHGIFQVVKNPSANAGDAGLILGSRRSLEKEIATHSSILAWEIPWTEEPGGLQSMGSLRVGHD